MWSALNFQGIFKVAFRDKPQVVLPNPPFLRMKDSPPSKTLAVSFKKQTFTIFKSLAESSKLSSAVFWCDRNQYCMNRAASLFPADYYSSPPQTADITHHHLAAPPAVSCSLTPAQLCLPMLGLPSPLTPAARLPSAPVRCVTCAEAAASVPPRLARVKWQWFPQQRRSDGEAWPALWSATCSNRCGSQQINGEPCRSLSQTPDLKSQNRKTKVIYFFYFFGGGGCSCLLALFLKKKKWFHVNKT